MIIALDTETTGIPLWNYPDPKSPAQVPGWPRLVTVAWRPLGRGMANSPVEMMAKPDGFRIPESATRVHGISNKRAEEEGVPVRGILDRLAAVIDKAEPGPVVIAAYNYEFDYGVIMAECTRTGHARLAALLDACEWQCVMRLTKTLGNHHRFIALKKAIQIHAPGFDQSKFHTASGDVTALVALMMALRKLAMRREWG